MHACQYHGVVHCAVSIDHTISLIESYVDSSVKDQFKVIQVQAKEAFVPRKVLGDIAAEPNGFTGDNGLGGQVDQHLNRLVVVDGHLGIHDIAQTIHGISLS